MRLLFTTCAAFATTIIGAQNVGIGTTEPQGILDVRSNISGSLFLENPAASSSNNFTVKILRGSFTPASFGGESGAIGVLSTGNAGYFKSSEGIGIYGATSAASYAIFGVSTAPSSRAIFGSGGAGTGVFGYSDSGEGLWGFSATGNSLYASKELGTTGRVAFFHNQNESNSDNTVTILNNGGGHGLVISKTATTGDGLNIDVKSVGASGIYAINTSTTGGYGIVGESNSGVSINGRKNGYATGQSALFENNNGSNESPTVEVKSNSPGIGIKVTKSYFGMGVRISNEANSIPSSPLYVNIGLTATSGSGNALFTPLSNIGVMGANLNSVSGIGIYGKNYGTAGAAIVAEHSGTGTGTALEIMNGDIKVSGANRAAFIHTVPAGTTNHITALSYAGASVTDILIVTPNFNPTGLDGIYNAHPIGVYWSSNYWTIFNQDFAAMPVGASFNVLVIKQ